MSEPQKRTKDVIQQEYGNMAMKAGHIQYQIFILKNDLELLNQALRDLNVEAMSLPKEGPTLAEVPKESV